MNKSKDTSISRFKIRTFLLLIVIYAISFRTEWYGVWGILFLLWIIPHIRSGHVHLAEPIHRSENPIWYWLVVGTWVWLSVYMILEMVLDIFLGPGHFLDWEFHR